MTRHEKRVSICASSESGGRSIRGVVVPSIPDQRSVDRLCLSVRWHRGVCHPLPGTAPRVDIGSAPKSILKSLDSVAKCSGLGGVFVGRGLTGPEFRADAFSCRPA